MIKVNVSKVLHIPRRMLDVRTNYARGQNYTPKFLERETMLKNRERKMAKNCKFTAQCTESKFGISSSLSKWGCA